MVIAYSLLLVGVFVLFMFFQTMLAMAVHWRDRIARRRKLRKLIDLLPIFFIGLFLFAFTAQWLLWYHGSIDPTEFFNTPEYNHGTVRYVNGAIRDGLWIAVFVSAAAGLLPTAIFRLIHPFRRKSGRGANKC